MVIPKAPWRDIPERKSSYQTSYIATCSGVVMALGSGPKLKYGGAISIELAPVKITMGIELNVKSPWDALLVRVATGGAAQHRFS